MTHNGKYRQKRPLKSGLKESRAEVEEERAVPEPPAEWLWPQNIAFRLACPKGDALGARLSFSDKRKHTSFSGEKKIFLVRRFKWQCLGQRFSPAFPRHFLNPPLRNSGLLFMPFHSPPLEAAELGAQDRCPKAKPSAISGAELAALREAKSVRPEGPSL